MKMWNVILLLGLLGMLPYADAFSLLCMPSSVNVSEPVSGVSIYVLTSSLDGNTIDANYSWFVDGNLLSSGATTLNFDGNAYSGSVPVSFPLADRNYTLTVNIDVNGASETNSCIIWAYDVPKIHIEPVPPSSESEQWTNVGDYNVWCEDSSACSLSVSINSEQILEANGQMNLNLDDGCNSVSITATDAYGEANEVNYYICVDTAPPTVRDVTVFRLTEDQCAYALSAEANDDVSGVDYASSSVLLDGNVFEEAYPEAAEGGYTGRFIVPTIPYGHHSLELNVCDYAGNCALSEPLPITVLEQTKCLAFEGPYFFGEEGNAGWYVGPVLITMRQLVDGFYALVDGEMTGIVTDITIATDGNHTITYAYDLSEGNRVEYNFYAAIDQYPPVIHSCSYDLLSGPSVGIEVNAQDVTSGLHGVSACMGGNCWQSVGNSVTIPLIGLDFNVEIASEDVAGNLSEPTTCTIHFDLNDFIAEVNVPSLVTASPLALELSGGEYNGPYIISIDDNSWESNASAVIPLSAGQHSLCIFVTDHNDINRCFEFNVDLAPPVVSLSAPTISRTRSVTVSWSASDDLYLSSVQLLVDGSAQDVPPSGSMALTLSYGSHNICVRATDLADRYSEECTRVLIRRPGGGGGGRPTPLPPSPKFPRDDMDREFLEILRFAGIEYNTVEQSGESSGAGIPRGASQLVTVAEEEFNRDFVPIPSRWIVREYVVDGEKYVFVLRRVSPEIERVYEYFPEDVNVYSPYLVRVFRGSLLAVFENSGEYYYVASAGNAGLPLYEVPPLPVKFRRERVEENVPVLQPHEENVTEVQKAAVTPYAVLGGVNERAVVAGLFVLAGVLALLLSYRRR